MFFNKVLVDQKTTRKITPEGYLLAKLALTKVGIQDYELSDMTGNPEDKGKLVGVFRPHETVFHPETIESAKMKPFTLLHPDEFVDTKNFKALSVGHIGEIISPLDSERLGGSLLVNDEKAIEEIKAGQKEISLGYTANIVKKQGFYKGQKYDYAFDGPMYVNHIALVPAGRCGDTVSILDKGSNLMTVKNTDQTQNTQADAQQAKSASDLMDMIKKLTENVKDLQGQLANIKKNNDELSETLSTQKKDAAALITDAQRLKIIDKVKPLIKEVGEKTGRELLIEACDGSIDDADKKSDDYLMAVIDQKLKGREQARSQFNELADSKPDNENEERIYDAQSLFKLNKMEAK